MKVGPLFAPKRAERRSTAQSMAVPLFDTVFGIDATSVHQRRALSRTAFVAVTVKHDSAHALLLVTNQTNRQCLRP